MSPPSDSCRPRRSSRCRRAVPPGGGTGYAAPHAWPAAPPAPAADPGDTGGPVRVSISDRAAHRRAALHHRRGDRDLSCSTTTRSDEPLPPAPAATAGPGRRRRGRATPAATTFAAGSGGGPCSPPERPTPAASSSTPTPPAAPVVLRSGGTGGARAAARRTAGWPAAGCPGSRTFTSSTRTGPGHAARHRAASRHRPSTGPSRTTESIFYRTRAGTRSRSRWRSASGPMPSRCS